MKLLSLVLVVLGLAAIASAYQVRRDPCAWGPTYWCKSRTNAQQCRQVHYCRQNFWKSSLKVDVTAPKDAECDLCVVLVGVVDDALKENKTKEEVKEVVSDICHYMALYSGDCYSMENLYFNRIYTMLVNKLEPSNVCAELHLCGNSTVAVSSAPRSKTTSLKGQKECNDCTKIVTAIGSVVNNSMTEDVAKKLAEDACDALSAVASECKVIVAISFDKLWELLSEELSPQVICEQLKLCSRNVSRQFFSLSKSPFGLECSLCKSLIGEIVKKFVNTSSTQARFESLLGDACNMLPTDTDKQECQTFIDTFFPTIWNLFMDDIMTPDELCSFFGVCGNTTKTKIVARRRSPSPLRSFSAKVGDERCDLCKEVITRILSLNQSEVKEELDDLCGDLPDTLGSECTQLVNQYFDAIWMIVKTLGPEQLCERLRLCNSTVPLLPTKALLKSDEECALCKYLFQFVDGVLARNSTEDEVLALLAEGCDALPSDYANECSTFVEVYGDTIYKMLISEMDPEAICSLIKACTSKASTSDELCEVCEEGLSLLKSLLPSISDTAVTYLTDLCGLMPSAVQDECKDFVKEYAPQLISLIADMIDPEKDCQMAGLCSKMRVVKMRRRSL